MPFVIGVVLAVAVGVLGRTSGMDRDRSFYAVAMLVIAALYSLFAVMGGSAGALAADAAIGTVFIVAAVAGFRRSLWLVAAALAGHGLLDLAHGRVLHNPGVPAWWPAFCSAYDLAAAGFLAWLLRSGRVRAVA